MYKYPSTIFKTNHIPWNKGITGYKTQPASEERKRKIRLIHKGKFVSIETRIKISNALKGKGHFQTEETKKKIGDAQRGEKSYRWNGGRSKDKSGYILIKSPNHPFCNAKGYVREHKLVVEKIIGRFINYEIIHHINSIKYDNRPENLMAFINDTVHRRFCNDPNKVKPGEIVFDGRKFI